LEKISREKKWGAEKIEPAVSHSMTRVSYPLPHGYCLAEIRKKTSESVEKETSTNINMEP